MRLPRPSRPSRSHRSQFEPLEHRRLLALDASLAAAAVLPDSGGVGSPAVVGSRAYAGGTFTVVGGGLDIGGTNDQFHFASKVAAQDVSLSARVTSIDAADPSAKSGVMLRNAGATSAGAAMAAVVVTPGSQVQFIVRAAANAIATVVSVSGVGAPTHLRLTRSGFEVSAAYSVDGVAWTAIGGPQTIRFSNGASRAGLAVSSRSSSQANSSTFANVAILGGAGGEGWTRGDVGTNVGGGLGSAGYDAPSGTHTLIADDDAADGFSFASKPIEGDASAVARINAIVDDDDAAPNAEAGVMIRADASAGSPFAAVLWSPSGGAAFEWRATAGGATQRVATPGITGPTSLKLVRQGDGFQGYYSATGGATWTRINGGNASISMPSTSLAGLAATTNAADAVAAATFTGVSVGATPSPGAGILTPTDELFLDDLGRRTANWFLGTQQATSGLFPDRANAQPGWLGGNLSSVASTGFGLSALAIAASRGWVADGYERALRTLNFLWSDADMANPANHGYFYHFVDQTTGQRSGNTELSSIDTALLISGVLTAGAYWKGTQAETLARQIYERVDWDFMQPSGPGTQLRHGWTPEGGFLTSAWDTWSEGPLVYLLAMGSPTNPIAPGSWLSFPRNQTTVTYAGQTFYAASGSPLFTNQYPQGWFDLRGQSDVADADPTAAIFNLDPYQNSIKHTLAQRLASSAAGNGTNATYDHFTIDTWGLTASDGPNGYRAYGGPPINASTSDGTIAPTAPGGSLAFTPRESIDCLVNLKTVYPTTYRTWGFIDAFNPRPGVNWYDNDALGIDQGMILVAAENLRSGLVWDAFMSTTAAQTAVDLAFTDNASLAPPTLASAGFEFETRQRASFAFAQDVAASFDAGDVVVRNATTGEVVPESAYAFAEVAVAGRPTSATVTFNAALPDGRYELVVAAGGVQRADGTANAADLVLRFDVLAGDATRDGRVDFQDLLVLAQNYGQAGRTFSQGNFDYGSDGRVEFSDLLILAQRYNTGLPSVSSSDQARTSNSTDKSRRSRASEVVG